MTDKSQIDQLASLLKFETLAEHAGIEASATHLSDGTPIPPEKRLLIPRPIPRNPIHTKSFILVELHREGQADLFFWVVGGGNVIFKDYTLQINGTFTRA